MKTFSTSGTGNQQTLSEIESNNVPIYDSLADVTADLANLSVGQIVATKDTGDELAQPVNVVESGNLHAVTSNAVAESSFKLDDHILKIINISFPAHTTQIDISSLTYTNAIVLGGAVYGSFGMRPVSVDKTYVNSDKKIELGFNTESWRDYAGSVILGYY